MAIVTREWNYHRDYLLGRKQKSTEPDFMGFNSRQEHTVEKIDKRDYAILRCLLRNARMPTLGIARKLNVSEMVVRYRIKQLLAKGIIIGFRPFLNVQKLGYTYFKAHFTLQNLTPQRKMQIFSYIHQHPATIHTTELVGGDDLETEFQVSSNEEFYDHIRKLREKFGDLIRDYTFMQYTQEYKFTYLPEMFSEPTAR